MLLTHEREAVMPRKLKEVKTPKSDLLVANHGSIFLLRPVTTAAREWVGEHIPEDAIWFGGAVAVEHRYIVPIVQGAIADGLVVS
jgi:hypothetical protein